MDAFVYETTFMVLNKYLDVDIAYVDKISGVFSFYWDIVFCKNLWM